MAQKRTFIDHAKKMTYVYDRSTDAVTAIAEDGFEVTESVTPSLMERLSCQISEPVARLLTLRK